METNDIIEAVTEPKATERCAATVPKKSGKACICVDLLSRQEREIHPADPGGGDRSTVLSSLDPAAQRQPETDHLHLILLQTSSIRHHRCTQDLPKENGGDTGRAAGSCSLYG